MIFRRKSLEKRNIRPGFTLMEMLVVVAIIVALAGLGGYYFLGSQRDALKAAAKVQLQTLTQACESYATRHNGAFPPSLDVLIVPDEYGSVDLKRADALLDPWSTPTQPRPFQYDPRGTNNGGRAPDIWCIAPDGTQIGNWMSMKGR